MTEAEKTKRENDVLKQQIEELKDSVSEGKQVLNPDSLILNLLNNQLHTTIKVNNIEYFFRLELDGEKVRMGFVDKNDNYLWRTTGAYSFTIQRLFDTIIGVNVAKALKERLADSNGSETPKTAKKESNGKNNCR